ncbi:hypothetical protein DBV14_04555 [Variovorax sp. KBW07]|uniref:hypothetical protein n=1 Tax=Variovorax sp. KBW07 TaxID=2153358 RepID=UPI000F55EE43|nr:hypothetical protein [Variovorax sp. KBW07]RQO61582.1 hypothetical protein DBV14_04555 [Variovorax sp. KBW07]
MLIDASRSPLVFLRTQGQSNISVEEQLQQLLDKGQRFVLITDHSQDDHHDETPGERKQKALFFKRVKDQMRVLCRGMIVLEGDKSTPAPMRLAAATASKAFGFTVAFVSSEDEAIRKGESLLAGQGN